MIGDAPNPNLLRAGRIAISKSVLVATFNDENDISSYLQSSLNHITLRGSEAKNPIITPLSYSQTTVGEVIPIYDGSSLGVLRGGLE